MSRLLTVVTVCLAAALLAACGSDEPAPAATVTGQVLSGPSCPVETEESPCPPTPVSGVVVQVLQGGDVVATATTDSDGAFTVTAPPGESLVKASATEGLPSEDSKEVDLVAGETTTVKLLLDSGIR